MEYKPVSEIETLTKATRLYNLAYSFLGQKLTLDTSVPKEYGCAEALSYVLKEFGFPIPARGIASTNVMEQWLEKNCTEVDDPEVGDIIISVSFTGVSGARGHCGIMGKKSIMSNSSDTGTWECWWSYNAWRSYYLLNKKLRTRYFRV